MTIGILTNIIVGIILINQSYKGHSILGLILGGLMPVFSLLFYSNYLKLNKNLNIKNFKKLLFKPSLMIGIIIIGIFILSLFMTIEIDNLENTLIEFSKFFGAIFFLFLIPNLLYQLIILKFLKKRI